MRHKGGRGGRFSNKILIYVLGERKSKERRKERKERRKNRKQGMNARWKAREQRN